MKNLINHNSNKEKRVLFIDIARGIAIILMIIGHVLDNGIQRSIIFSFHMPIFIIVSGFFYRETSLIKEIKNLIFKLLLPTTIIIFLVSLFLNNHEMSFLKALIDALKTITVCWSHKNKIIYSFRGTDVLWFIYLLIGIRIIFRTNKKIAKDNNTFMFCLIMVETYIGYIVGIKGYWLPWSIDISFACVLFYYIGYLMKKNNILEHVLSNYKILLVLLIIWILGIKFNGIEIAVRKYLNGLWSYITAISGSIIVLKISKLIEYNFKYISRALAWCGKYSLFILYGHYLENNLIYYNFLATDNINLLKVYLILVKSSVSILFAIMVVKFKQILKLIKISRKLKLSRF